MVKIFHIYTEIKDKCSNVLIFFIYGTGIGDYALKISFNEQSVKEAERQHAEKEHVRKGGETVAAGQTAFAALVKGQTDIMPAGGEKGKSLIELQEAAAAADVAVTQDYMTVMSNTMSEEDYAKMQEEGFDFGSMDPEEAVTIVDKIKTELARAGKNIVGYTDDLDMDTLVAALGSRALAQAVADSFRAADVPLTKENLASVSRAWEMGSQLQPLKEGSYHYLIDNELEVEIWNLYLAQSSGAGSGTGAAKFYAEDVQGYYTMSAGSQGAAGQKAHAANGAGTQGAGAVQDEKLQKQIDGIIEQSGREVNEGSRRNATWLLDQGLPVTGENMVRMEDLQNVELPMKEEKFAEAAAAAVAEGKDPIHASMSGKAENLYEKAALISEYYHSSELWEAYVGDVTARRQLEEVRLRMTAEVNVKLLKSGFSIDTAPMEELIEALKQAEYQLATKYFPRDAGAMEKYYDYRKVNTVADQLPGLPADMLGIFAKGRGDTSLEDFHSEGRALQEAYDKAQKSYETLMTVPRSDLGDSIEKAFSNVDAILEDLGMELTEENRRAVRILGYNHMEVNRANLETVREADRQVQSVMQKLTPAAALKMIRDGVNPLGKSFGELQKYFEKLPPEYKKEADSYSRFLYGLERNKEITPEERESYIGIFRLVRQIEKADGAVAGALVNSQAEFHFSNLLSALQNNRTKSLDVRVSDELGKPNRAPKGEKSITAQISKAFEGFNRKKNEAVSGSVPWLIPVDRKSSGERKAAAGEQATDQKPAAGQGISTGRGSSVEQNVPASQGTPARQDASADQGASARPGTSAGSEVPAGNSGQEQVSEVLVKTARDIVTEVSPSKEADREYNKTRLEEQRQAVSNADKECAAMLQRGDMSVSADNLMASQALIRGWEDIFEPGGRHRCGAGKAGQADGRKTAEASWDSAVHEETDSEALWRKLEDKEQFVEAYAELAKEALDAVEEATFSEADSSLDVRNMQLNHKQLTIAAALADKEEYYLPMYVGDAVTRVHLTLDRSNPQKGTVTIGVTISEEEHIQARLYLQNGMLHGMMFAEGKADIKKLQQTADNFKKEAGNNWTVGNISVIPSEKRMPELIKSGKQNQAETAELYRVAKVFLQSVKECGV